MKFKMIHENYNVSDLDQSIKFYNEALDLHEVRRTTTDDFIIVYLSNNVSDFELELTWLKDHPQPYNLGECEFHLAFQAGVLPANMIQAMRDYFGAHTYERIDKPRGEYFHTVWTGTGGSATSTTYNV